MVATAVSRRRTKAVLGPPSGSLLSGPEPRAGLQTHRNYYCSPYPNRRRAARNQVSHSTSLLQQSRRKVTPPRIHLLPSRGLGEVRSRWRPTVKTQRLPTVSEFLYV